MKEHYLGIDIGSVAISIALLDKNGQIVDNSYSFHKGQIKASLKSLLKTVDLARVIAIGRTSSTPSIINYSKVVDSRIAFITTAKLLHPQVQSLLIIGAEKFGLVTFDKNGQYCNFKSNTSCAAGTGNFLDQQAERLNIKDIYEFSRIAHLNKGGFPKIASRCAVFAKTDLIHAQQEGYSLGEICDGLSYGLAKNIVDTLFQNNTYSNIVAAGGVALNKAVIRHLEELIHVNITVDGYPQLYGAIGAAYNLIGNSKEINKEFLRIDEIIKSEKEVKNYYYPPLQLVMSDYPDFESHERYKFSSSEIKSMKEVEVDVYSVPQKKDLGQVFLGIDIGSTSTKAIIIDRNKEVIAGFYTRTSGQPLKATQLIFEAIDDFKNKRKIRSSIGGAGTTGSGRKFTGKIIAADIVLDEITAHARAAYELDPATDTIIEIGGQDSKFTVIRNGMVTFSVMNNVCAAGTGSFIEEQAKRLECTLAEYADRAAAVKSPLASDRCTVFMERDLNHYLMAGYSADEILAAVLHSTRENYFAKVAVTGYLGDRIFFQGATAKNRALVAAFEQKLKKPIKVSRYCHLTGAMGVALELIDTQAGRSKFRGLDLYKRTIPVKAEICDLCNNHCKIKIAEINGQVEAYGFLCGRDYQSKKYVKDSSFNFQLIRKRRAIQRFTSLSRDTILTIGIPAGIHLYDEILFWRKFFDLLSIKTVTSEKCANAGSDGKNLSGAEFCSPISAMHGHVNYLLDKADYIFLPTYLKDQKGSISDNQYCYYTQFVSSVIAIQNRPESREKILTPILKYSNNELMIRFELYKMFKGIGIENIGFINLSFAYDNARKYVDGVNEKLRSVYLSETSNSDDIHIVLLGRPYTVLSPAMNGSIPEIIEKMGIKTFYMDMLPQKDDEISKIEEWIKKIKWKFASRILHAANIVAQTDNCYPLLITSFKCTPDSFMIEFFKEIMDEFQKPYLILQLDEHDSTVGYETRIEAGIRAFKNHFQRTKHVNRKDAGEHLKRTETNDESPVNLKPSWQDQFKNLVEEASEVLRTYSIDFNQFNNLIPTGEINERALSGSIFSDVKYLKNKTLLLPSWDQNVGPLLEAVLQNGGINAQLINTSDESIRRSMRFNSGQCIPLNIIVQDAINFIERNQLNPEETALWIMKSKLACNICMYPFFMKKILNGYGREMSKVSVYTGDVIFYNISLNTAINAYLAYMLGGFIRKIGCHYRPYEVHRGITDSIVQQGFERLYNAFLFDRPKEPVLEKIMKDFEAIEIKTIQKPKVAIFGDLYVRDNDLMNQELIKCVEMNGGEVITTPFSEYMKISADPQSAKSFREGRYLNFIKVKFLKSLIHLVEEKYKKYFNVHSPVWSEITPEETDAWLNKFGLNILHSGESLENILKIYSLIKHNPDLDLLVQTNPSYCCPSLVTEAMTSRIEELTGIPIVTIEYDGTSGVKNEDVIPYLKYRKKKTVELTI